jgi:hypothetical protein
MRRRLIREAAGFFLFLRNASIGWHLYTLAHFRVVAVNHADDLMNERPGTAGAFLLPSMHD